MAEMIIAIVFAGFLLGPSVGVVRRSESRRPGLDLLRCDW